MAKKETVKEVVKDTISYVITLPDGNKIEGTTSIREFAPNVAKGFQNSGFQVKLSSGNYSGSLMIIDYLKQKPL